MPTATDHEDEAPPNRTGRAVVIVFVTLTAAFVAVISYGMHALRIPPGGLPVPSTRAVTPRAPCAPSNDDGGAPTCGANDVAWCDDSGRRVACCKRGLMAAGHDGICACPPGGTLLARAEGCPGPGPAVSLSDTVRSALPSLRACRGANVEGAVTIHIVLTPEGQVFSAALPPSSALDVQARACLLRVVQSLRFAPPPDGTMDATYPLALDPSP